MKIEIESCDTGYLVSEYSENNHKIHALESGGSLLKLLIRILSLNVLDLYDKNELKHKIRNKVISEFFVPKFDFDKSKYQQFKNIRIMEDINNDRVAIQYGKTVYHLRISEIKKLPFPMPWGFLSEKKLSYIRNTIIRKYREYLSNSDNERTRIIGQSEVVKAKSEPSIYIINQSGIEVTEPEPESNIDVQKTRDDKLREKSNVNKKRWEKKEKEEKRIKKTEQLREMVIKMGI